MRQIIISTVAILLVVGAYFAKNELASKKPPNPKKPAREIPVVITEKVKNRIIEVTVKASGKLAARDRIDIFSEVQGVFEHSAKRFDPGVSFKKGDILLQLNSDEHQANLRSQKSNLYNQIVAILPDVRFEHPKSLPQWERYVIRFNVENPLKRLPAPRTKKERLFIASKNITSQWHTVKNLEERLSKYTIRAPFSGSLTEAFVDKGALIRPGQRLGCFINPKVFELEVAVNSAYADLMEKGNTVLLKNLEGTKSWRGKVNRLNNMVDAASQTIKAFITVSGKGLREGMYLEAALAAKDEPNAYEVSRKLLVDNKKLFYVQNSKLKLIDVDPVFYKEKTVVVKGLPSGLKILKKPIPGAYSGMKVRKLKGGKK